jgi:hypothetical protein
MPTKQEVDSFYEFASSQILNGGVDLSMDEVYGLWRAEHPTPEELAASVAAVRTAYAQMEAGDPTRPARSALRETCQRLGLVIDE